MLNSSNKPEDGAMSEMLLKKILQEQITANSLLEIIANRIKQNSSTVVYSSDSSKNDLLKRIEELSKEAELLRSRAEQAEKSSRLANDEVIKLRVLVSRHGIIC